MNAKEQAEAVVQGLAGFDVIECCGRISRLPEQWRAGAQTMMCKQCRTQYVYRDGRGWIQRVYEENCN